MSFRVRERVAAADVVTLANAGLGMVATVLAVVEGPDLAARLILLAAVADGLDGLVARRLGGSRLGLTLDSMADVVSFGVAPAAFVFAVARAGLGPFGSLSAAYAGALALAALFAVVALLRTALYTVYFAEETTRPGVQNTLAASLLAVAYLAAGDLAPPGQVAVGLLAASPPLAALMLVPVGYPKLTDRDALAMGVVQMGAVLLPAAGGRAFPRALLLAAVAYTVLAPRYYWG